MIVSRCCRKDIDLIRTDYCQYFVCSQCHRACGTVFLLPGRDKCHDDARNEFETEAITC